MSSKPNIILPTILLGGIAALVIWEISSKRESIPARSEKRSLRPASRSDESISRKPAPNLADDELLAIYRQEGPAAALAAAKALPWPYRDERVFFILRQMAIDDPESAATELKTSGLRAYTKTNLLELILKNWNDGRKALDWAENKLTGELRCKAVAGALAILVKTEPEVAFSYLEKFPPARPGIKRSAIFSRHGVPKIPKPR